MKWPLGQVTDEQAMWRVQTHDDHSAFAMLVERWEIPLRRLAVRMLGDEHRAEDVSQEAFTRVFARRRDFRTDARFSTWVWRITLNLCHDELRRRYRRPENSLDSGTGFNGEPADESWSAPSDQLAAETASPAENAALADTARRVRTALQELPELYRSVVVLRHYEGLKFSEIAEVLNIPEGTVKSRMVESLSRLAKVLGPLLEDPTSATRPVPSPRSSFPPQASRLSSAPLSTLHSPISSFSP